MCGLCEADPNAKEGQCPPLYGSGADTEYEPEEDTEDKEDSAQTKFIKSHQSTMIFVMVIISFISSSYEAL